MVGDGSEVLSKLRLLLARAARGLQDISGHFRFLTRAEGKTKSILCENEKKNVMVVRCLRYQEVHQ